MRSRRTGHESHTTWISDASARVLRLELFEPVQHDYHLSRRLAARARLSARDHDDELAVAGDVVLARRTDASQIELARQRDRIAERECRLRRHGHCFKRTCARNIKERLAIRRPDRLVWSIAGGLRGELIFDAGGRKRLDD